jgi:dynactin complex subunit
MASVSSTTPKPTPVKVPVETETFNVYPSQLKVGLPVFVHVKEKNQIVGGLIRFIGKTTYQKGYWIGVELVAAYGDNNGALRGHAYFLCKPNCGIFIRPNEALLTPPDEPGVPVVMGRPAAIHASTNGVSSISSATTSMKTKVQIKDLSNLLKTKLSTHMDLLNQQLELVELLDKDSSDNNNTLDSLKFDVNEILTIVHSGEVKVLSEFKVGLQSLLRNSK